MIDINFSLKNVNVELHLLSFLLLVLLLVSLLSIKQIMHKMWINGFHFVKTLFFLPTSFTCLLFLLTKYCENKLKLYEILR